MALGSIHGQRTKIPQAVQCGQTINKLKITKKKTERERGRKSSNIDIRDTELKAPVNWLSVKVREKESWMMPKFSAWAIKWNAMLLTEGQNWLGANKYD